MEGKISELMTKAERDVVMAPIESAMTPPAQAYASQDWFDLEVERVFSPHWMGVLFECSLPDPGDTEIFDFLGMPLFAVRGKDNRIRVFHNICPYDGCLAVRTAGKALESIDTYYHGWRYDLEGYLIEAPFWTGDPGCTIADLGEIAGNLVEVRSETRLGAVFVNLNGEAESVDDWLAPWLKTVSKHFAIDRLVPARDAEGQPLIEERTVAANWKTYQENASINILHESFTHALYEKSPEVPRVDSDGNPTFQTHMDGCLVAFSHRRTDSGETYDPIHLPSAGINPEQTPDVGFFSTIYPNLNVPLLDSFMKVNIAIPVSPDQTKLLHLRFYSPEALADEHFQQEEVAIQELFDVVHHEDQLAIEAVQQARRSPVWRQHFYAPFWDALHHYFNQLMMKDMEDSNAKPRDEN